MAISPAQIARAAEALNRYPGLSQIARRVALELLSCLDRVTGLAWPSESRMAEALGVDARSIRRGKAELAALGLLSWQRRGTSWRGRTPIYKLALDRLALVCADIKEKVKAATLAARDRLKRRSPAPSAHVSKTPENHAAIDVGRTKVSAYLTQCFSFSSGKGFWRAPGTPEGQALTDQQLDARAHSRLYTALQGLGQGAMAAFLAHPAAIQLEAEAIRAERFKPDHGRTGLAVIAAHLNAVTP